jgi:7-carboxy-7-deazaguanine synthase
MAQTLTGVEFVGNGLVSSASDTQRRIPANMSSSSQSEVGAGPLAVSEIFGPTIQGEGSSMGRNCAFVRLFGCNLKCQWCDSKYAMGSDNQAAQVAMMSQKAVFRALLTMAAPMIVVTGGEPLLQQSRLEGLLHMIRFGYLGKVLKYDTRVEIETNGTIRPLLPYTLVDQYNVSPKLRNSGVTVNYKQEILDDFIQRGAIFKFVVKNIDDLDEVAEFDLPQHLVWIMALGTNSKQLDSREHAIVEEVIKRGWNLSTRLHVRLWGNKRGV